MKIPFLSVLIIFFLAGATPNIIWGQDDNQEKTTNDSTKTNDDEKSSKKKKPKEPKFEDLIEDYTKVEGLFTIYINEKEGKVYLEIRQDQFGPLFLCNITRQAGDASIFDSGAMMNEFPFFIKMVGKNVQFIQKNVAFRADKEAAIRQALERHCREADVERFTPHTLRHAYAGHTLRNGGSLDDIQAQLGHADIATTAIYLKMPDEGRHARHAKSSPRKNLGKNQSLFLS